MKLWLLAVKLGIRPGLYSRANRMLRMLVVPSQTPSAASHGTAKCLFALSCIGCRLSQSTAQVGQTRCYKRLLTSLSQLPEALGLSRQESL